MTSAFLDLGNAVVAALSAAPALAGGNIRRGRDLKVPSAQASAIDIHVLRSRGSSAYVDGSLTQWTTLIGVDLYARAAAGVDGETAIDGLLADVFARLAAAEPPAGAEQWTVDPTVEWDTAEADQTLVRASLVISVIHFTGPSSLQAAT